MSLDILNKKLTVLQQAVNQQSQVINNQAAVINNHAQTIDQHAAIINEQAEAIRRYATVADLIVRTITDEDEELGKKLETVINNEMSRTMETPDDHQ